MMMMEKWEVVDVNTVHSSDCRQAVEGTQFPFNGSILQTLFVSRWSCSCLEMGQWTSNTAGTNRSTSCVLSKETLVSSKHAHRLFDLFIEQTNKPRRTN